MIAAWLGPVLGRTVRVAAMYLLQDRPSVMRVSVVTRAARRRWAAVLGGVLVLGAVPPAIAALPVTEPAASDSAAALAERVRRSDGVAHEGLAEIVGHLGLPDLPRLDDTARLLGGQTRARVWWADATRWRVA